MIQMEFSSARPGGPQNKSITIFNSYSFDRNILTPASAFRFTAPGINKSDRLAIRSGDIVRFYITNDKGTRALLGVGFIDETDTHVTPTSVEYVLTGRDVVGQLVDNDTVDNKNQIIYYESASIETVLEQLLKGTRAPQGYDTRQLDTSLKITLATNNGETKINALQRYLEFMNGLVWADNDGTVIAGKPDFTQNSKGNFTVMYSDPSKNNVLECRVRRNVNQAIRQIVTQLNDTQGSSAAVQAGTLNNMDKNLKPYLNTNVGRSVSRLFSYASGREIINQGQGVGHGSYAPHVLGTEYSAREIARDNMKILDIEIVVEGHFNSFGGLYNIDQIYQVVIEDEDVSEPMYVYNVAYELSMDHGMITRMRLCRKWTICAYADQLPRVVKK